MARRTELDDLKLSVIASFHARRRKILTYADLGEILSEQRHDWQLAKSMRLQDFLSFLVDHKLIRIQDIRFRSRNYVKYLRGNVEIYDLLLSLHPESYFSHHTAMHIHSLTPHKPNAIYLNVEQRPKNRDDDAQLLQDAIDKAFQKEPRITTNVSEYDNQQIFLLNGMYTGNLGVEELKGPKNSKVRATSLERTVIDIAVKPAYSGGVAEVLRAYRAAKGKLSPTVVARLLKKLNFVYPFHQVVGFYMHKAGYDDSALAAIRRSRPIDLNFYLTHGMRETEYSPDWKLFFPKGL